MGKKTIWLVVILIAIIFLLLNTYFLYKQSNKNVCGNGICEIGETSLNCRSDCVAKIDIRNIQVRTSNFPEKSREDYIEGEAFFQDEVESDSNIGEIYAFLSNNGDVDIENLYAKYRCIDFTYNVYDVCKVVSNKVNDSFCEYYFSGSDEGLMYKGDKVSSTEISYFPKGTQSGFVLHISPMQYLKEVSSSTSPLDFHNISCTIDLISETSGIKQSFTVNNYFLRPD
jgi:hypothetical protein